MEKFPVTGNLNPAVSVGLLVGGELPLLNALLYILVQVIVYEDDRDEDENDEKDFEIDDLDRCRSMSVREQLLCIQTALSLYGGFTLTAFK